MCQHICTSPDAATSVADVAAIAIATSASAAFATCPTAIADVAAA